MITDTMPVLSPIIGALVTTDTPLEKLSRSDTIQTTLLSSWIKEEDAPCRLPSIPKAHDTEAIRVNIEGSLLRSLSSNLESVARGRLHVTDEELGLFAACIYTTTKESLSPTLSTVLNEPFMLTLALSVKQWMEDGSDSVRQTIHLMLHLAVDFDNPAAVLMLLQLAQYYDLPYVDIVHDRLLVGACAKGYIMICEAILDLYPESIHATTSHWKPLERAITASSLNSQSDDETCALVKLLIKRGADPNAAFPTARFTHGYILQLAVRKKSIRIITTLLDNGAILANSGAAHLAAALDSVEMLDYLSQRGADLNEILKDRVRHTGAQSILSSAHDSVIDYAVRCESANAVKWLLDNGVKPEGFQQESWEEFSWERNKTRKKLAEMIWKVKREQHDKRRRRMKSGKTGKIIDCWAGLTITKKPARSVRLAGAKYGQLE